jgi:hypothetical protein
MQKPESRFIGRVNQHLPIKRLKSSAKAREHYPVEQHIHYEKMHNDFYSGTADTWYSGIGGDVWIEYKYLPRTPVRASVEPQKLLTPLQLGWLEERHAEGRSVGVIIGCPDGGVRLSTAYLRRVLSPEWFRGDVQSPEDLARWIMSVTTSYGRKFT